jgi:D-aspartate ligase
MSLPPAVLLGSEASAVSAARSLSKAGVEVYGLGDPADPLRHSRHCHHFGEVGSKEGVEARYMAWLESGPRGAVVIPCYDDGLDVVTRNRATLVEWGYLPVEGDDEVNLAMIDKVASYERSRAAGVPAPRTAVVSTPDEARAAAADFEYPCALKPVQSHLFARHFGETKLLEVHDEAELSETFERTHALGIEMLLTEIIPGGDDAIVTYYTYLDERGEPLYHFTKQKLRQWPIRYGLASYQLSTWDPHVAEVGYRFCRGVGIRGIGTVEFKRDARDGRLKMIECNPRLTGSNELVRQCGIEVAEIAYRRAAGLPVAPVTGYRTSVHAWYPVEDFRAMLAYASEGELTPWQWARSLMHRQHFAMLNLDDPMPTVAEVTRRLSRFSRKVFG